jgi:hypothetical protein
MSPDAAVLAMQSVARSLRELARVPARAAAAASVALEAVVRDQESREVDPYEKPWAPLLPQTVQRKRGDTRILRRSDVMLDSLAVHPLRGSGLAITFDRAYSAFHQIGTRFMAARRLLPVADLPPSWRAAISGAYDRSFSDWAAGART